MRCSTLDLALTGTDVYFGSRLIAKGTNNYGGTTDFVSLASIASDRLGSIGKFYPYGQEKPSATANDTEKFTGYFRDAATGLDYAVNRYHQPGMGRFMTADPAAGSMQLNDPGSQNRYAYTRGDPVNRVDPGGTDDCDANALIALECDSGDGGGDDGYDYGSDGCSWSVWACPQDVSAMITGWYTDYCAAIGTAYLPNGGSGGTGSGSGPCGPPVTNIANTACTQQQLNWINAHGQDAWVAAQELSLSGNTGEADILALSAVESGWGMWRGYPGGPVVGVKDSWFGMHGPLPGQTGCVNITNPKTHQVTGCVSTFASFEMAANAFVDTKGQLVIGQTNPQAFFTTLTSPQGGFAIGGAGVSVYTSVEQGLDNCLNSLNGFNN